MSQYTSRAFPAGELLGRAEKLQAALEEGHGRIETELYEEATLTLRRVHERLSLSTEHTVVGFFGATGSGKSTLFNALAGRPIARTAPIRPTTLSVQAAVWGATGSDELLDWLGVGERIHIQDTNTAVPEQEKQGSGGETLNEIFEPSPGLWNRVRTAMGRPRQARSGGLILLDMPDFDSVQYANRQQVERMLGYVDVLVWVLDPQKYADAVLHRDFIRPLASHGGSMLCVLNQADRLDNADIAPVLESINRLLAQDGVGRHLLAEPLALSALTGAGLDELGEALGRVAAAKSAALVRVQSDVERVRRELMACSGSNTPAAVSRHDTATLVQACFEAAGAEGVLDAAVGSYRRRAVLRTGWVLTRWIAKLRPDPLTRLHLGYADDTGSGAKEQSTDALPASSLPPLSPAQRAQLTNAIRAFGASAAKNITEPWHSSIAEAALRYEPQLPGVLEEAIAGIDYRTGDRHPWWGALNALQWLGVCTALLGALWLTGLAGAGYLQIPLPSPPVPESSPVPLPTLLLITGGLLGVVTAGLGRGLVALGVRTYQRRMRRKLSDSVAAAVTRRVVEPVTAEIARLERYRGYLH